LTPVAFEVPTTIRTISAEVFADCSDLRSFTVPSSVSTLGDSIFSWCTILSCVTFGATSYLINSPDFLFEHRRMLKMLDLPHSVKSISDSAFPFSSLASVTGTDYTICDSLLLGRGTLMGCLAHDRLLSLLPLFARLERVPFAMQKALFTSRFGFCSGGRASPSQSFRKLQTFTFPASPEVIGEMAFSSCSRLREVLSGITSAVHKWAFRHVYLSNLTLPATLRDIDASAFIKWPGAY
jgi:hypothetical protein